MRLKVNLYDELGNPTDQEMILEVESARLEGSSAISFQTTSGKLYSILCSPEDRFIISGALLTNGYCDLTQYQCSCISRHHTSLDVALNRSYQKDNDHE